MNTDLALIIRDKYNGDASKVTNEDRNRMERGEPLAYIIGFVEFLGCRISLSSFPLIPRDETEYWTDLFIKHALANRHGSPVHVLDLCAGSGAIGIAILTHVPHAHVTFSELSPKHTALIERNLRANSIDSSRYTIYTGDLFECLHDEMFDFIVSNPPYIPQERTLPDSVALFEPHEALFAGVDGLDLIRVILEHAGGHLLPAGEVWIECDVDNIKEAEVLAKDSGFSTRTVPDQYERLRVLVAY